MGRRKGEAREGVAATMPRQLAEEWERRERNVQGGNALCQWAAAHMTKYAELPEAGPAGTFRANMATSRWVREHLGGLGPWRPTCEEEDLAADRRSLVWVGDVRINNGRGSMVWDAVLPDRGMRLTPVSFKGGKTASDMALGASLELVRALVAVDAPLWVAVLEDSVLSARPLPYLTGVETHHPAPTGPIKVGWHNITPRLKALDLTVETPEGREVKGCRVRAQKAKCKVEDGVVGEKVYLRLNIKLHGTEPQYRQVLQAGEAMKVPGDGW